MSTRTFFKLTVSWSDALDSATRKSVSLKGATAVLLSCKMKIYISAYGLE